MSDANNKRKKKGALDEKKKRSCSAVRKLSPKMKRRQAQGHKKARASGKGFVPYRSRQQNPEIDRLAEEKGTSRANLVYRMSISQKPAATVEKRIQPQIVFTSIKDAAIHLGPAIKMAAEARWENFLDYQKIQRRRSRRRRAAYFM